MSHKLARCRERALAEFAAVWLGPGMGVDVILQGGDSFEATLAHRTLMRSVITVRFHVTREEVTFARCVVAVVAHVRGLWLTGVGAFLDDSDYVAFVVDLGFVHFLVEVIHFLFVT